MLWILEMKALRISYYPVWRSEVNCAFQIQNPTFFQKINKRGFLHDFGVLEFNRGFRMTQILYWICQNLIDREYARSLIFMISTFLICLELKFDRKIKVSIANLSQSNLKLTPWWISGLNSQVFWNVLSWKNLDKFVKILLFSSWNWEKVVVSSKEAFLHILQMMGNQIKL